MTATAAAETHRVPIALRVTAALFAFLAFIKVVGSFLFAFSTGTLEGFVGGSMLIAWAIGYVIALARLHHGERGVLNLSRALALAEVAWSFYKVVPYGETESAGFLAAGIVASILLFLPVTSRFVAGTGR